MNVFPQGRHIPAIPANFTVLEGGVENLGTCLTHEERSCQFDVANDYGVTMMKGSNNEARGSTMKPVPPVMIVSE
ncbi:hypothetical protein ES703_84581 [subsurface metagenome]